MMTIDEVNTLYVIKRIYANEVYLSNPNKKGNYFYNVTLHKCSTISCKHGWEEHRFLIYFIRVFSYPYLQAENMPYFSLRYVNVTL